MKKKTGKTKGLKKCPMVWLPGSDALPPGAVKDLALAAEENGGWLELDSPVIFDGMKYKLSDLATAFSVLSDPKHPKNNWACIAEKVLLGNRMYLHLIRSIPAWVKSFWKANGHPPSYVTSLLPPCELETRQPDPVKPPTETVPTQKQPERTLFKSVPVPNLWRHPKNPFRAGSGYGLLVDIIAWASPGILKEPLLNMYCTVTRKSRKRATFDLAVIESAQQGKHRLKSCRAGFEIIKGNGFYSIRFD